MPSGKHFIHENILTAKKIIQVESLSRKSSKVLVNCDVLYPIINEHANEVVETQRDIFISWQINYIIVIFYRMHNRAFVSQINPHQINHENISWNFMANYRYRKVCNILYKLDIYWPSSTSLISNCIKLVNSFSIIIL